MLSVDLRSDRASCGMKPSKTDSWSGRRAPRVPAELSYSSLRHSRVTAAKHQEFDNKPAGLIMFGAARLTAQSLPDILSKALGVGDSANGWLTPRGGR